jgi:hypothetical protein
MLGSRSEENGRNVPTSELNERRLAAVRMRVDGSTIDHAAAEAGLSRPTVIKAYKAYKAGGWDAVPVRGGRGSSHEHTETVAFRELENPRRGHDVGPHGVDAGRDHRLEVGRHDLGAQEAVRSGERAVGDPARDELLWAREQKLAGHPHALERAARARRRSACGGAAVGER